MGAKECQIQTMNPKDRRDNATWGVKHKRLPRKVVFDHFCFAALFLLQFYAFSVPRIFNQLLFVF